MQGWQKPIVVDQGRAGQDQPRFVIQPCRLPGTHFQQGHCPVDAKPVIGWVQRHRPIMRCDSFVEAAVNGRRGAGTQNHCMHGKDAIIEDILDWRPFDYVTLAALLPIPGAAKILMTYAFEGCADGGTRLELRFAKPKPKDLPFFEQVWPTVQSNFNVGLDILRSMLEERATASDVAGEPSIPVSHARFLTQSVHSR